MGGKSWLDKVLALAPAVCMPFTDTSGTSAKDYGSIGQNGTYFNDISLATAPGPPGFRGQVAEILVTGGALDFYSAALASAMNLEEHSMCVWMKIKDSSYYTDTTRWIYRNYTDASNNIGYVNSTTPSINLNYRAGGTLKAIGHAQSSLDWFSYGHTVSKTADELKLYFNGSQKGTTQTGLGTYSGTLHELYTCVGASAKTATAACWVGWIAGLTVFTNVLSAADMLDLYNAGL